MVTVLASHFTRQPALFPPFCVPRGGGSDKLTLFPPGRRGYILCPPIVMTFLSSKIAVARYICLSLPNVNYQRTSISVNIKERLDFSCAVFDSSGGLVANAPHLPVHLGAMQEAVR